MMKRIYMLLWLAGCLALSLSAQQTKELYLLQTSDMHSRVEPLAADAADADAGKGGLARRAAFVRPFCAIPTRSCSIVATSRKARPTTTSTRARSKSS